MMPNIDDVRENAKSIDLIIQNMNIQGAKKQEYVNYITYLWDYQNESLDGFSGFFAAFQLSSTQYVATIKENDSPLSKIWNAATGRSPFHRLEDDWVPVEFFENLLFLQTIL